ncbi:MAG: hypothetical protein HY063_03125 [Bacteroidetes bacterium]|nr:hypothetical protein [Bacteroidota bacterium]
MKKLFAIACAVFLLGNTNAKAQLVYVSKGGDSTRYVEDSIAEIKLFTATYNEGKVYLKWLVANQHADGTYIIFRSSDGKNFETIGTKNGIGVPISNDIAYYFTDENPCAKTAYYKLLHIGSAPTYLLSEAINIATMPEELCNTKNKQAGKY